MEFDSKQKVLMAIYTEYQKDIPDMANSIRANILGLDMDVFKIALEKLENERLIIGVKFARGGNSPIPLMAWTDNIKMTTYGIQYVEDKLNIDKTLTGSEKVKNLLSSSASWGWDQFKDIAAKTMAEMLKG